VNRHFGYVLQASLAVILQTVLEGLIGIDRITPDLAMIFLVTLTLREGRLYAMPWGFAIGLAMDLTTGGVTGLSALAKTSGVFFAGYFYDEHKVSLNLGTYRYLIITASSAYVHNVIYFAAFTLGSGIGLITSVFGVGLASAVYTTILSALPMLLRSRKRIAQ
jgi:rod shape-determining protein MreD